MSFCTSSSIVGTAPWKRGVGWVRKVTEDSGVFAARDAEMFHIRSGERRDFLPPVVGRKIQIHGAHEIADAAALVGFFDAGPEAVELGAEQIGFVEQDGGVGKQIEDGAVGSGDGRVKLPSGKHRDAAGAHRGLDDFFRARRCACRKAGCELRPAVDR